MVDLLVDRSRACAIYAPQTNGTTATAYADGGFVVLVDPGPDPAPPKPGPKFGPPRWPRPPGNMKPPLGPLGKPLFTRFVITVLSMSFSLAALVASRCWSVTA